MGDAGFLIAPKMTGHLYNSTGSFLPALEVSTALWINDTFQNGSSGVNTTSRAPPRWTLIGLAAIPVWILFGNILVLLSVLCNRALRTLSNWVIASLAFTDFLLAIIVVPLGTYQVVNQSWNLGLTVCIFWTGSDVFLSTTSIMHLCVIAIHRYLGISNPLRIRSSQDRRHVLALLVPAWSISFAISIPLIVQGAMDHQNVLTGNKESGYLCGIFDQTFVIYSSLVSFFIPLTIMVFADIRSVQILRKNMNFTVQPKLVHSCSNGSSKSPTSKGSSSVYELTTAEIGASLQSPVVEYRTSVMTSSAQTLMDRASQSSPTSTPQNARRPAILKSSRNRGRSKSMGYIGMLATRGFVKINSRERRAEQTLIWVFVCFVVLWLPFFCTNLTYGICRTCDIPDQIFLTFTWLGYISSGVNPCIYTLLNRDFRTSFKNLILCRQCRFRQNR